MIWKLFGGWQGMVLAGLLAGAVATLAFYVSSYDARGREIVALQHRLSSSQNEIRVLEASQKLARDTIEALNKRLSDREHDIDKVCSLLNDVTNSTDPTADDPVDPLTGSVLEQLKEYP